MKGTLQLLLALSLAVGCASPGSGPPLSAPGADYQVHPTGASGEQMPPWAGRERSWQKLRMIGDWLAHEGAFADDFWVVEAHLELAEGRAAYAPSEPALAEERRQAAIAGFLRVLAHPGATASQRQRAQSGLDTLDPSGLLEASAPYAIPGVLPRSTWGARPPALARLDPADAPWNWITVHHSAEPGAKPLSGSLNDSAKAIRDIQTAHMSGKNYGDIGYHFVIDPSGRVFQARELRYQGAHAYGKNNIGNVGICLLGNFEHEHPTQAAVEAMHGLIDVLRRRLGIPPDHVRGHYEWRQTACPGRYLKPELERYRHARPGSL